ncbi:uncharacterized protein SPPG_05595 [Spizellomyces punctatus DAOM BR117]|uniref:Amino acid permease n=1 Tax=Spizellomyces punctatus (strain DAOM BR117) TaxID=645134 RepID=A0A0L0HEZ7_SPIPD|nr:uncharacterized protein SPPG_05595 [Spizellomyces punctatus DAOM BR117]KNC99348.1 hypothetical protein SPPG_05595 [Spizellomyces punctatus DAOM BR117]|eukprot:XP_016607388.1 hypothetical protein SPPG_05595 [Spizellomyces punctatus DAOM BR117]
MGKQETASSSSKTFAVEEDPYRIEAINDDDHDPRRRLGLWSTTFLIFNRMIGTGIFATPASVLLSAGSVGMALIFWVIGTLIAVAGMTVYLEYGTAIPKSGGEKNYLEFVYRRPKLLATCVYAWQSVLLGWAGSNSIVFGQYVLFVFNVEPGDWNSRALGLLCVTFAFLIHAVAYKWGVRVQNALGVFKIIVLLIVVFSGFAALGGHLKIPKPDNFSNAFDGTTDNAYNYASGLYKVIWSFIGYSNANYALGEVKRPIRTIKIAAPLAIGIVSALYMFANIAYFAGVPLEQFRNSGVLIAGQFFINVFGETFGRRVLPAFVALSALGNVMSVIFSQGRINQELGKEGVLPFSRVWASNWPFKAPFAGLGLHWVFSVIMMLAPPPGSAYNFIVDVITYPLTVVNVFIAIGLLWLRFNRDRFQWKSPFNAPLVCIIFFLACNVLLVIFPFLSPPGGAPDIGYVYWLPSLVGILVLVAGALYWAVWWVLLPKLGGYQYERVKSELADGTPIFEYRKIK